MSILGELDLNNFATQTGFAGDGKRFCKYTERASIDRLHPLMTMATSIYCIPVIMLVQYHDQC